MSVQIKLEPDSNEPGWVCLERCCFCGKRTGYWHTPKDVPVCLSCAETHEDSDVPSKKEWCASPQGKAPPRVVETWLTP